MEVNLFTAISSFSAIGAAGVAGIIAASTSYMKFRNERLTNKRRLLYFLLELRSSLLLHAVDHNELLSDYIEFCDKHLKLKQKSNLPDEFKSLILVGMKESINCWTVPIGEDFIKDYNLLLQEVAREDPVLAWKIKGKEFAGIMLDAQDQHKENFVRAIGDALGGTPIIDIVASSTCQHIKSEVIKDFDDLLMQVANACGGNTFRSCKKIITEKRTKIDFEACGVGDLLDHINKQLNMECQD